MSKTTNPIDQTICDREPIHNPGSIQPHGMMLIAERNSFIVGMLPVRLSDAWGLLSGKVRHWML